MKNLYKKLSVVLVFTASFLFLSCEKDLYEEKIIAHHKLTSQKISFEQVISEIDNPVIKKHINEKLKPSIGFYENRTVEDYLRFLKIIKENHYTTYSFLINTYSFEKPYFEYFIITKEGSDEKAGYARFIPNYPIAILDEKDFDGKLQVSDLQGEIKGDTDFMDSQPVPTTSTQSVCVNSYQIVVHQCTGELGHNPGDPNCTAQDGYYEVIISVICTNVTNNYIAAPPMFMGFSGSGGGGITSNTDVYVFLNLLTDDQRDIMYNNPELITYLEDNYVSQESKDFVLDCILQMQQNPNLFTNAIPFLIEKNIDDSQLDDCTKGILNQLKSNHAIAKIMARLDNPDNLFKISFSQEPNLVDPLSNNPVYGLFQPTSEDYNYTIKLNSNNFNNTGATNLGKAKVIIHELIHALIASVLQYQGANLSGSTYANFPEIWNAYVNIETGGTTPDDHTFMGNHYVDVIASALQEYDTGIPVEDNVLPEQIYNDLAWSGLFVPFSPTSPFPNLTNSDLLRISVRQKVEMENSPFNGINPTNNEPCVN